MKMSTAWREIDHVEVAPLHPQIYPAGVKLIAAIPNVRERTERGPLTVYGGRMERRSHALAP